MPDISASPPCRFGLLVFEVPITSHVKPCVGVNIQVERLRSLLDHLRGGSPHLRCALPEIILMHLFCHLLLCQTHAITPRLLAAQKHAVVPILAIVLKLHEQVSASLIDLGLEPAGFFLLGLSEILTHPPRERVLLQLRLALPRPHVPALHDRLALRQQSRVVCVLSGVLLRFVLEPLLYVFLLLFQMLL